MKGELMLDYPSGALPTRTMPVTERMRMLRVSVDIIKGTHLAAHDDRTCDWGWFFRGYNQWHSLSIIIAELSWTQNQPAADEAWSILDVMLEDWDKIYERRRGESAWDHVNTMIARARHLRRLHLPTTLQESSSVQTQAEIYQHLGDSSRTSASLVQGVNIAPSKHHAFPSDFGSNEDDQNTITQPQALNGLALDNGTLPLLDDIDFAAFDTVFGNDDWNLDWDYMGTDLL